MISLKVAFKRGIILREKSLFFDFTIGALEYAVKNILKIEFKELGDYKGDYDLNIALLYGAYYYACMKRFKKPRYNFHHAVVWYEYLNKESREQMTLAIAELLGEVGVKKKAKAK